jgi:hypothetical protein
MKGTENARADALSRKPGYKEKQKRFVYFSERRKRPHPEQATTSLYDTRG